MTSKGKHTVISDAVANNPEILLAQDERHAHITKILQHVIKKACLSERLLPGLCK
jgi:hypothetical protein